jgi:hypothetical protein
VQDSGWLWIIERVLPVFLYVHKSRLRGDAAVLLAKSIPFAFPARRAPDWDLGCKEAVATVRIGGVDRADAVLLTMASVGIPGWPSSHSFDLCKDDTDSCWYASGLLYQARALYLLLHPSWLLWFPLPQAIEEQGTHER